MVFRLWLRCRWALRLQVFVYAHVCVGAEGICHLVTMTVLVVFGNAIVRDLLGMAWGVCLSFCCRIPIWFHLLVSSDVLYRIDVLTHWSDAFLFMLSNKVKKPNTYTAVSDGKNSNFAMRCDCQWKHTPPNDGCKDEIYTKESCSILLFYNFDMTWFEFVFSFIALSIVPEWWNHNTIT